jgi:succinate dehydrogenase subunit D
VTARWLAHRGHALWLAALVHRLSGLALAAFLPLHFIALGLAIEGEAKLEGFLRWSDRPLVKLSEAVLMLLLTVHMLGGLRLLVVENFAWLDGQKRLAVLAVAASVVVAFAFLASVL